MTATRVFKFGGASVRDADSVRNVASIMEQHTGAGPVLVVVSAMDKMTNAFEELLSKYFRGQDFGELYEKIRTYHLAIAGNLFAHDHQVLEHINDLFVEIDWIVDDEVHDPYDYLYDQVVSVGELLSSRIVSACLAQYGIPNHWLDVRDVLRTDERHREARVDWDWTANAVSNNLKPLLDRYQVVVTQGFIGGTSDNSTSTLGREGSDYSAAIFANLLDAGELVVWKDVPGIMTGDPKVLENVELLNRITYREAIEMTYYGAKVIHPRTIKPLQNKNIPLYVRSFQRPGDAGTLVGSELETAIPPVIVIARDQCMIHISTRDYSFIAENHLGELFTAFARHRLRINLMRNTAISFSVCCAYDEKRIGAFREDMEGRYNIVVDTDLELFTIRHGNPQAEKELLASRTVYFEERIRDTVQYVVRKPALPRLR